MLDHILISISLILSGGILIAIMTKLKADTVITTQANLSQSGLDACQICNKFLPVGSIRTHDGKWRCGDHKQG